MTYSALNEAGLEVCNRRNYPMVGIIIERCEDDKEKFIFESQPDFFEFKDKLNEQEFEI